MLHGSLLFLLHASTALAATLERRQTAIGSNICATAMQGFTCDASNHNQNRCAGDDYHHCICYGSANGSPPLPPGVPQGFWGDSAWGPPCDVCKGQDRGAVFDGICLGDDNQGQGLHDGGDATVTVYADAQGRPTRTVYATPQDARETRRFQHPWGYIHHPTPSQKAASRAAIAAVTAHQDARLQAIRLAARGGCGPLPSKVTLAQEQKIEKPKEMAQTPDMAAMLEETELEQFMAQKLLEAQAQRAKPASATARQPTATKPKPAKTVSPAPVAVKQSTIPGLPPSTPARARPSASYTFQNPYAAYLSAATRSLAAQAQPKPTASTLAPKAKTMPLNADEERILLLYRGLDPMAKQQLEEMIVDELFGEGDSYDGFEL